jgi:energy-coupling factor transporter ATP-binding protein EcfA2
LSPTTSTLLLDEPDSHLHPSLQAQLVDALEQIAQASGKQVLLATHSTEILRAAEYSQILAFSGKSAKYLKKDRQKTSLFIGLGSEYAPKLDPLRRTKRMLIVESDSDARLLAAWAAKSGINWPSNVVVWPWTGGAKERKHLFLQLKEEIPDLKAISLRDRDDTAVNQVDKQTLCDKSVNIAEPNFHLKVWRRRHIENYLLYPPAIARACNRPLPDVIEKMAEHALVVPADFTSRDVASGILDARGKEILNQSIEREFRIKPIDIANAMLPEEVAEDVKYLIRFISEVCET